jgi:ferredoxin
MIYYFTGAGNSRYVAQRIAQALGDTVAFIPEHIPATVPDNGEPIGFVFPVYFWGIPTVVDRFARQLKIEGKHYTFTVLTPSGSTGAAASMFEKALSHNIDTHFCVLMPDTYAPMFECGDKAKSDAVLQRAEGEIDSVIAQIKARATGDLDLHHGMGRLATATMYPLYRASTTRRFAVNDACTGCGLCERLCPDHFITIKDGRPTWRKGHCNLCFACLHHCPHFAIQYGRNSRKHGQYVCPLELKINN